MGLLDILAGMQSGPRGQPQPTDSGGRGSGGGVSPIMMALLALLAYKAIKSGGLGNILGGGQPAGADRTPSFPPGDTARARDTGGGGLGDLLGGLLGGAPSGNKPGGSLADLIPGGFGGLLGGAGAGSVLTSGLGGLLQDLQNSGQGRAAQSWVSAGPNEEIAPNRGLPPI